MGDITLLDESKDVGARNLRQLAALYCGATSGFEVQINYYFTTSIFSFYLLDIIDSILLKCKFLSTARKYLVYLCLWEIIIFTNLSYKRD